MTFRLLAFCLLAPAALFGQGSAAGSQPNLLVLVTDDQRWDTIGALGHPMIQTPNLDRLANRGVLFENAFVTTSICATSRASLLTGQYARRHGVWDFATGLSLEQLNLSYLGVLKAAGYRIGFIGKWGVGEPPRGFFDYDRAFAGQGQYFRERPDQGHLTAVMADQAIEFLQSAEAAQPFCLSVSFKAPHVQDSYDLEDDPFPFDPRFASLYEEGMVPYPKTAASSYFDRLPPFLKNSENRLRWAIRFWGPARYQESVKGYYRLISGVDASVGRILAELENRGLAERTIILFTSDNGFFLGERGLAGKWLPYEESIRVPLMVWDPRMTSRHAQRRSEMVLNIDLAPTILELAGLGVPKAMQGLSLIPLIDGVLQGWRSEFFYEHLFSHPRIPVSEAVRSERWKYIRYPDQDPLVEELYDLQEDPLEESDLIGDPGKAGVAEQLRASWRRWRSAVQ